MGRPLNSGLTSKHSLELGFSFDKVLGANLEPYRNAVINQDYDCAVIVDGKEGSGKSVFAQQIAVFLDKDHHLDIETQICFTPNDFIHAVQTLEKGKAIVWDEARRGVNRRRSLDNVNLDITDMLAECRQNNLFLVIVMPTFYDMDMNVAVWRTRLLIHVLTGWTEDKRLERGLFRFYSELGKKLLYTNKIYRQRFHYPHLSSDSFRGRFPHHYCVDEEAYRAKKRRSEGFFLKGRKDVWTVLNHLREKEVFSKNPIPFLASFFDVTERTIYNRLNEASTRV